MAVIFEPIRTERLILRPPRLSDAEAAFQRRSLPEVARYQDWELPYTREQAERRMAEVVAISWGGRSATIGYTFHPDHWGHDPPIVLGW